MGPKVDAAIEFACKSGRDAVIGALVDLPALRAGEAGTRVSLSTRGVTYR
jgi:carbamate kinase